MNVAQIDLARSMVSDKKGTSGKKNMADKSFADLLSQKRDDGVSSKKPPSKTENKNEAKPSDKVKDEAEQTPPTDSEQIKTDEQPEGQKSEAPDELTTENTMIINSFGMMPLIPVEQKGKKDATAAVPEPVLPLADDAARAKMQAVTGTKIAVSDENAPKNLVTGNQPWETPEANEVNPSAFAGEAVKVSAAKTAVAGLNEAAHKVDGQAAVIANQPLEDMAQLPKLESADAVGLQNPAVMQASGEEKPVVVNDSSSLLQRQTTQQVADQIISRVRADGAQQFTMQLHPEKLGHVTVNMILEAGHMTLKVETHTQLAQNLLMGNIAELKSTLENNGVQVSDVEIMSYADQQQDAQQQAKQQSEQNNRHGAAAMMDLEPEGEEAAEKGLADSLLDYSV